MSLTTAQLQTLKADILADPALSSQPNNSDGNTAVAQAYDAQASPDFWVWRSKVTEDEYTQTAGVDAANGGAATVWNWTGAGYVTRSQGERDAWARLFRSGYTNPSLANVRQAFGDILSGGTAPAPANRNHLLVLSKRRASRVEKLLAAGTGTFASPATMGFEGSLTADDVEAARK